MVDNLTAQSFDRTTRTRLLFNRVQERPIVDVAPTEEVRDRSPLSGGVTNNGSSSSATTRRGDLAFRQQMMLQRFDGQALRFDSDDDQKVAPGTVKSAFGERVAARFGDWDKNGDKFLSAEEIDAAMIDASNTGEDAAALATLKRRIAELQVLSDDEVGPENDGLSEKDLATYRSTLGTDKGDKSTEGWFNHFKDKINGSSRDLFAKELPDWQSVKQGSIGDCWFIAALVAKAKADPEAVKNMIKDNGNGTYTVTLPGRKPVTVDRPTDAQLGYYATAGQDGLWAAVLEKAYGQVKGKSNLLWNTKLPQDELDGGGPMTSGIGALTTKPVDSDLLALTRMSTTRSKLDAAFQGNKIVTAGINKVIFADKEKMPLPTDHAYSIVGWDRSTDTVTIRNPWGNRELRDANGKALDGSDDGVFKMTLKQFYEHFGDIAYEGK